MLKVLNSKLSHFERDKQGSIAVITAFMFVVLCGITGLVVDYSRLASLRGRMTNAMDAAVLAVGIEMRNGIKDKEALREVFERYLNVNLVNSNGSTVGYDIKSFDADWNSGDVSANIESFQPTTLLAILNIEQSELVVETAATFGTGTVEVAMVLDVTRSMGDPDITSGNSKLDGMIDATSNAIEILLDEDGLNNTRIGLVPYASSINAGDFAQTVSQGNLSDQSKGYQFSPNYNAETDSCVTGREGDAAFSDASYTSNPLGTDNRSILSNRPDLSCPSATIQPLTNSSDDLISEIENYAALGGTAGHLGIAWGYYLLSENWVNLFESENRPKAYNSNTTKVMILMTDGDFNLAYTGIPSDVRHWSTDEAVDRSEAVARGLCDDIKQTRANGEAILIYTVGFAIEAGSDAEVLMQDCATPNTEDKEYYFRAENNQQLDAAFRQIAADISELRISR